MLLEFRSLHEKHLKICKHTMSSSCSIVLLVLVLFLFISFLICISAAPIPISPFAAAAAADPLQRLAGLASAAVARAHHLKNGKYPKNVKNPPPATTTPLFPFNGAYTASLAFGTPPQPIPMIVDTGSSFSWLPCTKRYVCRNCSATAVSAFLPKQSSSSKFLGCTNPKCGWLHQPPFDPASSCRDCQLASGAAAKNCTQICPPYIILYGQGTTGGVAMVETLTMPHEKIEDFLVGCSLFSSNQPAGVVGFGRGASSLPSQLKLKKFSYCHVSHKYDNTPSKSSFLLMDSDTDSGKKTGNLSYTPLLKNPVKDSDYYYIGLKRIVVGGEKVEVSHQELVPDGNGNGGTIVDSGSTFVYMNKAVFKAVSDAFSVQVTGYGRAPEVEGATGLRPCFDITGHEKDLKIPKMEMHFKGGAEMVLPLENYFFVVDDGKRSVLCLTAVTDDTLLGPDLDSGPSVILGNFLMQNFHVEYDLRNERFGFRQQPCS